MAPPSNAPDDDRSLQEQDAEFEALLAEHLPNSPAAEGREEGELLDATVVGILDDVVLVDTGTKAESPIPRAEFSDPRGNLLVKIGDTVRVLMSGYDEDGNPELSYKAARRVQAQRAVQEALEHKVPVRGFVRRSIRGGLIVDIGMDAFMPASQADILRVADLDALVGQEIEAHVLEFNEARGRAVLSRRQLLQERRDQERDLFFKRIKSGDIVTGTVRDVVDFGVFVDLGGGDGLIPRSELTYDRGTTPDSVVQKGQRIDVKVLEADATTGKITLSRKRLNEDPWLTIQERYPVGTSVTGRVVDVKDFGAFVQLEEGITGLIHASAISWETAKKTATEVFHIGDQVTCQVAEIDTEKKRLSLSLKHLSRDPWQEVEVRYAPGTLVTGTVSSLRPFGAFVKLDEFAEGLLHVSDMAWEKRVNDPAEVVQVGQQIQVRVLELERDRRRIKLGMKQVSRSPLETFAEANPVGSIVTGTVSRLVPFGAFVELAPGVEGLVHVSELDEVRVDRPEKVVRLGQELTALVQELDLERGRVSLSRRKALRKLERQNIESYMKQSKEDAGKGLGGIFGEALKKAQNKKKR